MKWNEKMNIKGSFHSTSVIICIFNAVLQLLVITKLHNVHTWYASVRCGKLDTYISRFLPKARLSIIETVRVRVYDCVYAARKVNCHCNLRT